jgi:xanthine dehydrogenase accessory factor
LRDVLDTLEQWAADGVRFATATVIRTERSAPREPGAVLAVSQRGDVAGSVTGGCVEPAVYEEARAVLAGEPPRLRAYGIADEEAFEVGLPCGGTVHIFIDALEPELVAPIAEHVRDETPVALVTTLTGPDAGAHRLVRLEDDDEQVHGLLAHGRNDVVYENGEQMFVSSFAPRPRMYVFGAIDHAAAVARMGRFLGYHVTVCDARARFVTRERIPEADELVVEWPDRFLESAPVDERTAIVVLTHDHKFDVPLLRVALKTRAAYIGAMGSRRTTEERAALLRDQGLTEEELVRLHAPIGLDLGGRTPAEVAVAVAAELIAVTRGRLPDAVSLREAVAK